MRCLTRLVIVIDRSLLFPCLFPYPIEIEAKSDGNALFECPVGKGTLNHEVSSSKQSLLGKACLFSGESSVPGE
jgi:hypothetical protein